MKFQNSLKRIITKKEKKLYTQALASLNITRKVLKIKEIFPNLQTKKLRIYKKSSVVKVKLNLDVM